MTRDNALRRKLRKLQTRPASFFLDSSLPPLRSVGRIIERVQAGGSNVEPVERPPAADTSGGTVAEASSALTEREIVEASGLFDPSFYVTAYRDTRWCRDPLGHYLEVGVPEGRAPNAMFDPEWYAAQVGIDPTDHPLLHYLKKGEAKGGRPRPDFDPRFYRAKHPDVDESGMGALQHYIEIGLKEGCLSRGPLREILPHSNPELDLRRLRVTIVLPVYGGTQHVRRCVESLLTYTHLPHVELLIIDDASPDERTTTLLERYARIGFVTVLRNETNLGFTRTVNRGLRHASDRDVVLLNSDTVVSPRWLENLALVAYATPAVATVTPLSDNAGAFSTPAPGFNPTSDALFVHEAARLSQRAADAWAHEVPTGNGFCLYMRREAIDATGLLDDSKFPRGYGEENDWCMRASDLGFRHLIALRAYVHHVNAASFGASSKTELVRSARAVLDESHPDYGLQIRRAFEDGALERQRTVLRSELRYKREQPFPARKRALFVVPNVSGGTPATNRDLMAGVSSVYDPLLLVSDSRKLQLLDHSHSPPRTLEEHTLLAPIQFVPHRSAEYDAVVSAWMVAHGVEIMHVRHLAWHGLGLVRAARRLNIPVVLSFHDFYTVCPSVNLTNGRDPYFRGGVTSPHIISPIWERRDAEGHEALATVDPTAFLDAWRRRMSTVLADCDAYVTTSATAKEILVENFPILQERAERFQVVPHGRDFELFLSPPTPPTSRVPLRVLVPGNISESKGLHTLLELLRLDEDRRAIELHTIGNVRGPLRRARQAINHGPYDRSNFAPKVAEIRPHIGLVASIWPETYCHTLTECWACGLPVVGSELGAVGERIERAGAGWTIDALDARALYELLLRIRESAAEWQERAAAVVTWQQTEGTENTIARMATRYLDIYRDVQARHRLIGTTERAATAQHRLRKRIALVAHGHYPLTRATVHVRIAGHVHQASGNIDYDWISCPELLSTDVRDYDGVIVCRNAAPANALLDLARRCRLDSVPLVLDLDDDLLFVPSDKDPRRTYRGARDSIRSLLETASLTIVSTPPLEARYADLTREIRIVPNRLDPRAWLAPTTETDVPQGLDLKAPLRAVYMGSATHEEDLRLVLPALEKLRESHGMVLHLVGIMRKPPGGISLVRPPDDRYDLFARWFRSISSHFDVAIAPLVDTPFNRSKSALKFMEYAICGLPVVASRVAPYDRVVRDGVDGFLAGDDPDEWIHALTRLADDSALRTRIGAAARARAESEFIGRDCVFDELPWDEWRERLAAAPGWDPSET